MLLQVCDSGSVASQSNCEAAVNALAADAGQTPGKSLQVWPGGGTCGVSGWGVVPMGCSVQVTESARAHSYY